MQDDLIALPFGSGGEKHLEDTICQFHEAFPGWWFSVCECDISCDASCAPTGKSPDLALIPQDSRFNEGFHADLPQPSTLSEALLCIMMEASQARAVARAAMGGGDER